MRPEDVLTVTTGPDTDDCVVLLSWTNGLAYRRLAERLARQVRVVSVSFTDPALSFAHDFASAKLSALNRHTGRGRTLFVGSSRAGHGAIFFSARTPNSEYVAVCPQSKYTEQHDLEGITSHRPLHLGGDLLSGPAFNGVTFFSDDPHDEKHMNRVSQVCSDCRHVPYVAFRHLGVPAHNLAAHLTVHDEFADFCLHRLRRSGFGRHTTPRELDEEAALFPAVHIGAQPMCQVHGPKTADTVVVLAWDSFKVHERLVRELAGHTRVVTVTYSHWKHAFGHDYRDRKLKTIAAHLGDGRTLWLGASRAGHAAMLFAALHPGSTYCAVCPRVKYDSPKDSEGVTNKYPVTWGCDVRDLGLPSGVVYHSDLPIDVEHAKAVAPFKARLHHVPFSVFRATQGVTTPHHLAFHLQDCPRFADELLSQLRHSYEGADTL